MTELILILLSAALFDRLNASFPGRGMAKAASASETTADTGGRDLQLRVHRALRAASKPDRQTKAAAIHELAALYGQLDRDTNLARATREQLRAIIRSRLSRMSREIQRQLTALEPYKLDKIQSVPGRPATVAPAAVTPSTVALPEHDILAQQQAKPRAGAAVKAAQAAPPQAFRDYGPQLVELIQKTIAPSTWDVQGGPGTIVYYEPLQVLVVRQSADVQGSIGGLVEALRK